MYQSPFPFSQNPYGVPSPAMNIYQQPAVQKTDIVKVNGKNGADAYPMAPNSQILLLDETAPRIFLKSTDGAGYAQISAYNITPYEEEPAIDAKSFEERLKRLEAIVDERIKPDNRRSKSKQADDVSESD